MHSHRNLETEKSDKSELSRKIHVCPEIGKKGPEWPKMKFSWVFRKFYHYFLQYII